MKILVVFTGGTIGSTKGDYIASDEKKPYILIEKFRQRAGEREKETEFEYQTPYTILSENLSGVHIRKLADCVSENLKKDYDGIIVTHGTDTLQYSAAALSYALGMTKIPVVLVSSNYVLEDGRANGLDNFCCAVDFIGNHYGNGVFVSYRNMDGKVYFHRGTRVLPHLPYSDEVFSVKGQYYGFYENGVFTENERYRKEKEESSGIVVPLEEKYRVLRVIPYPQMSYPQPDRKVGAVLLESYHSGTICGESPELAPFLTAAEELGIPVFLTGAVQGVSYESTKAWENRKIHVLPAASNIAMYVKLWMLTAEGNLSVEEICRRMRECVAEDIVP